VTGDRARVRRQGWTALALWYAAALVVPAGLTALVTSSEPVGGLNGRTDSCTSGIHCLLDTPDGSDVFRLGAGFLAVSLVVAVPLCFHLLRAWKLPVLAASVAAFVAWWVTAFALCLGVPALLR